EDGFHVLLVVVAGLCASIEHVAEKVVIGRTSPSARVCSRCLLPWHRFIPWTGLWLPAAKHFLEDLPKRIVAIWGLRGLVALLRRLLTAPEDALENLAQRIIERVRILLRRLLAR